MYGEEKDLLDKFLLSYPVDIARLASLASMFIHHVMPDAKVQVDPSANLVAFGLDNTYKGLICSVTIHKNHINLMFAQGIKLFDPEGLLSGTGRKARHVHIESESELKLPGVRTLLEQTAILGGLGC